MPCFRRKYMPPKSFASGLQMHTVVHPPVTALCTGSISCRPLGQEPIRFEWQKPPGCDITLDETGSEALDVQEGLYRVVATDANGFSADVSMDVEALFPNAIIVTSYQTTPASNSNARDGTVEAVGIGLEGKRFLWTHGTETSRPKLHDVPCGLYAATLITNDGDEPIPFVHLCGPARVSVGPL